MERYWKKGLILCLVLLMLTPFLTGAEGAEAKSKTDLGINPTPQKVNTMGEGFPLTQEVGIVTGEDTDEQAIKEVAHALKEADVQQIVRKKAGETIDTPVTIWIGVNQASKDILQEMDVKGPEKLKDEGYVLASKDKKVVLAGKDKTGTYYAAETFTQLIQEHGKSQIPEVEIRDWPEMPIRGTIEGFYGPPWTHEDRVNQLEFYGDNKLNTYIYAPKDDPYHREKWREPYPEAKLKKLQALIDKAKENHVQFTFSLSPGQSVCYSGDKDFQKLMDKMQTMWDMGVRSYAIFLDDISQSFHCQQDKEKFGDEPGSVAEAQAYFLNRFNEEFIQTHEGAERLITVPTGYSGNESTVYREQFAEHLNKDTIVMWTGPKVVSEQITSEGAEKVSEIFQHDLLLWDNYPVNDFKRNRLFLGPLDKRATDLTEHGVMGITANPMNEAEASKIPLYTVADYAWNSDAYDPQDSWNQSIQSFGGDAAEALKTFAENSYSSAVNDAESLTLGRLVEQFWQSYTAKDGSQEAEKLIKEFKKLQNVSDKFHKNMENEKFLKEVKPYLQKLELYGKAGEAAVNSLMAEKDGQSDKAEEYRDELISLFNEAEKNQKIVGEGVIKPFLVESALKLPPMELTLKPVIDDFWNAYNSDDAEREAEKLVNEFNELKKLPDNIRDTIKNEKFLSEIEDYLKNLEVYGESGTTAVDYLMAKKKGNKDKATEYKTKLRSLLEEVHDMPQEIGEQTIKPFLVKSMWDFNVVAYRPLDGVNKSRGAGELIKYTPEYGDSTGTNIYGYEVTVVDDKVVKRGGNNSSIPDNGYVLSVHASDWLTKNAVKGATIKIKDGLVLVVNSETNPPRISVTMNGKTLKDEVTLPDTEKAEFTWKVSDEESGVEKVTAVFDGVTYYEGSTMNLAGKPGTHTLVVRAQDVAGNVQKAAYKIHVTTSAEAMKKLVERFQNNGEITNDKAARKLKMHLTAIEQFVEDGNNEKVMKHLKGFKKLINHQKDNNALSDMAYDVLKTDTAYLIDKNSEGDKTNLGINPTPQKIAKIGKGFPLTSVVGIVTGENTDEYAIEEVVQALKKAGVKRIVRKQAGEKINTPVTLWIGGLTENTASKQVLQQMGITGPKKLKEEGYVLASKGKNIVLAGKDKTGTYYAADTFTQLIQAKQGRDHIPEVEIRDWPEMPIRGSIEGFYGPPWTHEDRMSQLEFYGDNKMNTYIYAPKDDPYHREKWREAYPEKKLKKLEELINKAQKNHVKFTFSLSPGNTVCYTGDKDFQKLMEKMQTMWDLGVRSYAIFLDDIQYNLHCQQDKDKFGDEESPVAAAQAYLLNRFNEEFIQTHEGAERLITVPTDYAGNHSNAYRKQFADSLNKHTIVMWTGPKVVSEKVTSEGAEKVSEIFQHELLLWDNYPVNDYDRNRLFLGPLVNRDADLTEHGVIGLTANPMNEAEASKIPLYTIADFTWNPTEYNPKESWKQSIQSFGGDAAKELQTFAENSYSSPLNNKESLTLKPLIEKLWKAYGSSNSDQAAENLMDEFKKLQQLPEKLQKKMDNKNFLKEVKPYLKKIEIYGETGESAVKFLMAEQADKKNKASEYKQELIDFFNQSEEIPRKVGEGVLREFFTNILWGPNLALNQPVEVNNYWHNQESVNGEKAVDGDLTSRWASGNGVSSAWLVVKFPEEITFNQTVLRESKKFGNRIKNYEIQYWNGSKWVTVHSGDTPEKIQVDRFESVTTTKVRLNITNATYEPTVWEFGVYNTNEPKRG